MSDKNQDEGWIWLILIIPDINGDWLVQAQVEQSHTLPEIMTVRRPTKINYAPPNQRNPQPQLQTAAWTARIFDVVDEETIFRFNTLGIRFWCEAPEILVDDAMKCWVEERVIQASEAQAKGIIDQSRRMQKGLRLDK